MDMFTEGLYRIFKKDKDSWNQDDLFFIKAISDFMHLLVENKIEGLNEKIKDINGLHCVFVAPSEWEEESSYSTYFCSS